MKTNQQVETIEPPPQGYCPICATQHASNLAHNRLHPYYMLKFLMKNGRHPTWCDAVAHCSAIQREIFEVALKDMGVWDEPEGEPIADPPQESLYEPLEIDQELLERDMARMNRNYKLSQKLGGKPPFSDTEINVAQGCKNADEILTKVVLPNLEAINKRTGQENDPKYLAYFLEHICNILEES